MNVKSHFKNAWNEPRRFFFYLALFCSAGLVVFFLAIYPPRFNVYPPFRTILLWGMLLLVLGTAVGILGFILSWIPPIHRLFVRMLRRRFFLLACLITFVVLFYAVENFRGRHAWEKYKRAHGEQFDLRSLVPPLVPDDQNFAMSPIWVEEISAAMGAERATRWYGSKVAALGHTNFIRPFEMPIEFYDADLRFTNNTFGWQNAEKFDLNLWQDYYRKLADVTNFFPFHLQPQTPARDVLLALSKYDPQIEALRFASSRPYSRFPIGYSDDNPAGMLLPHLATFKRTVMTLRLRAVAELEAGEPEKAWDDIKLMLRLTDAIRNEPILISHLVRAAILQILLQPVWEGLAGQSWDDTQLAALNAELAKLDFLADYEFCIRAERAFAVGFIDFLKNNRWDIENLGTFMEEKITFNRPLFEFSPGGWFELSKISVSKMHTELHLPIINLETRVVSLPAHRKVSTVSESLAAQVTPLNWTKMFLLPRDIPVKFVSAQSSVDQARIACALERYRLSKGKYPESLNALAPQFLKQIPRDIIGGQSLKYRRTEDVRFILYSVGWNETDDGGIVVVADEKIPSIDLKKGDWVWQYSTNAPAIQSTESDGID